MKNPTFSRFTHCKSVFSFALNNFISAFFACIFFIYTRFEFTYNAVYDINGEWTGEGITEYYKKGERIDETAYNQIFVDFNISQNDDVSCSSENVQHFTRDEILEYLSTEMAEEN